ncbi:MAG TPA: DUF4272 domain-containing protein, partial [Bacteroidetes bacterium]|nr:DUF4272 domain-containing protein [Bacteroidota bacterium]
SGKSRVSELEVKVDADFVLKEVKHSEAAKARKVQNETLLAEYEVPTNRNLPPIVDAQNAHLRSKTAVADRALALCLVALQGEGLDQAILNQVQAQFEISGHLSPKEQAFLQNPDQLERATFAWRYEALNVMMWALGYVEVLAYPDRICDVQQIVGIIRNANSREGFQAGAKLRTIDELLDQADLAFRLHWACVDAGLREVQPSADLNCGVVYQRLYALNWLHGDQGSDWDDVHTGTYAK